MKRMEALRLSSSFGTSATAIDESRYAALYPRTVIPWFEEASTIGTFRTLDGRRLSWRAVETPNEKGALVVIPGWTEAAEAYAELFYNLKDSGYSFYILDLRGQGLSEGDYPTHDRWYVADWRSFLSDVELFFDRVVNGKPHSSTVLYGFSMGGAIATAYLADHPEAAQQLILVAPMFGINISPVPLFVMRWISVLLAILGLGTSYLPGHGPWAERPFEGNPDCILSRVRFEELGRLARKTSEYRAGGATAKGGIELLRLSAAGFKAAGRIHAPTLLVQAGADKTVRNSAEDAAAARIEKCTKVVIPNCNHIVMMQPDGERNQAVNAIRAFLASG